LAVLVFLRSERASLANRILQGIIFSIAVWKFFNIHEGIPQFPFFQVHASYRSPRQFDVAGSRCVCHVASLVLLAFKEFTSIYLFLSDVIMVAISVLDFMAMQQQLYVNYRLKTVSGVCGKVVAYQFLDAFIDDLSAFSVSLTRLAHLNQNIVFFFWMDQRQHIGCPTSSVASANLMIKIIFNILRSFSLSDILTIYLQALLQSLHPSIREKLRSRSPAGFPPE
jgi:hypothetical protein